MTFCFLFSIWMITLLPAFSGTMRSLIRSQLRGPRGQIDTPQRIERLRRSRRQYDQSGLHTSSLFRDYHFFDAPKARQIEHGVEQNAFYDEALQEKPLFRRAANGRPLNGGFSCINNATAAIR